MIKRELSVFLIVGALTVLVDFTSYRGLLLLGIMSIELAKAAGSITSPIVSGLLVTRRIIQAACGALQFCMQARSAPTFWSIHSH